MSLNSETAAPSREPELTPVLFRWSNGQVTAVFVCEPHSLSTGAMMGCVRAGQPRACTAIWLRQTRRATPSEYEGLKRELEADGFRLKVFKYRTRPHKIAFGMALDRLRGR